MQVIVLALNSLPKTIQSAKRVHPSQPAGLPLRLHLVQVDLDFVVHARQTCHVGLVLVPELIVPSPPAVHVPKFGLVVVRMCVQPLHAAQLANLVLQRPVSSLESLGVFGAPAPDAHV